MASENYTNGFQDVVMSRKALGLNRLSWEVIRRNGARGGMLSPVKQLKCFYFYFQKDVKKCGQLFLQAIFLVLQKWSHIVANVLWQGQCDSQ